MLNVFWTSSNPAKSDGYDFFCNTNFEQVFAAAKAENAFQTFNGKRI